MTAEERIAQLELELAREQAKTARVEAALARERAENASLLNQAEWRVSFSAAVRRPPTIVFS